MNHKLVTMSRHSTSKCFSKSQDTLGSLGFMYFPHLGIFRPLQDIYTIHIYIYTHSARLDPSNFKQPFLGWVCRIARRAIRPKAKKSAATQLNFGTTILVNLVDFPLNHRAKQFMMGKNIAMMTCNDFFRVQNSFSFVGIYIYICFQP